MTRRNTDPTEEMFLKDVADHEMTVVLDNGIHRHLRFKKPGTGVAWFDIVTWPGFLAYTGDMGSFVFTRLEDMFQFFRDERRDSVGLYINRSYWGEKLEAVDSHTHHPGHKQFSSELLRQQIEEHLAQWVEDWLLSEEDAKELRMEIGVQVMSHVDDDSEHEAREAVRDFSCKIGGHLFEFQDSWEWDCREYTFRFTWCCYALAWAIKKYDARKGAATK